MPRPMRCSSAPAVRVADQVLGQRSGYPHQRKAWALLSSQAIYLGYLEIADEGGPDAVTGLGGAEAVDAAVIGFQEIAVVVKGHTAAIGIGVAFAFWQNYR